MIELKQIRKDYGKRTVIKNQSLSIKDKEFFVLIGPSGSGKTTLLKLINRLIDPTEGCIIKWKIRHGLSASRITAQHGICLAANRPFP